MGVSTSTHYQDVFGFNPEERCCNGIKEALSRYKEILPHLMLAAFLLHSFLVELFVMLPQVRHHLPVIEKAMTIVEESKGADGQAEGCVNNTFNIFEILDGKTNLKMCSFQAPRLLGGLSIESTNCMQNTVLYINMGDLYNVVERVHVGFLFPVNRFSMPQIRRVRRWLHKEIRVLTYVIRDVDKSKDCKKITSQQQGICYYQTNICLPWLQVLRMGRFGLFFFPNQRKKLSGYKDIGSLNHGN
ncbi:Copine [Artemisia annua]|uniref:Copine n=1 Tax=Artemisia annua TaxID=35608 RepID=A0A2U1NWL6_ARTAN|nr:Copine [Artemisia annua]